MLLHPESSIKPNDAYVETRSRMMIKKQRQKPTFTINSPNDYINSPIDSMNSMNSPRDSMNSMNSMDSLNSMDSMNSLNSMNSMDSLNNMNSIDNMDIMDSTTGDHTNPKEYINKQKDLISIANHHTNSPSDVSRRLKHHRANSNRNGFHKDQQNTNNDNYGYEEAYLNGRMNGLNYNNDPIRHWNDATTELSNEQTAEQDDYNYVQRRSLYRARLSGR